MLGEKLSWENIHALLIYDGSSETLFLLADKVRHLRSEVFISFVSAMIPEKVFELLTMASCNARSCGTSNK